MTPSAPGTRRTWIAAGALVGVTLIFYHGLWLPGLVLIKRDAFRFFLPIKQYLIERLAAGELPQWYPYEALGRPFIGTAHTGVFHPFTLLYALMPASDAYRASALISCLLAALGAFALGRLLGLSRSGALIAGLGFALSGYVVSTTDNIVYLYAIGVLPLFCAALDQSLRKEHVWMTAPAVIWTTVFLNGDLQTGYYYFFIALLWTAARAPASRLHAFARLTAVAALTMMLAAIQLAPAWAVFSGSDRTSPASFHEQALRWSSHPLRLATMIAAPVGGDAHPVETARYFFGSPPIAGGASGLLAESLYLGLPLCGLAIAGMWHRRDLRVLSLLGMLAVVLALGRYGGLYDLFYRIVPFWSAFRYPEKFMGVAAFAVAMLAGAGLDALRDRKSSPLPWLAASALCAAAWLGLRTDAAAEWTAAAFGSPADLSRAVAGSAARGFLFSAMAAMGMGLVAFGIHRHPLRAGWLLIPAAIIAADLGRANLGAYHTAPAEAASFTPPFIDVLKAREGTLAPGRFRLVSLRSTYFIPSRVFDLLGYYGAEVASRHALDLEYNAQFHLESADHYLPGLNTALAAMVERKMGVEAAARYNVKYYVGRRGLLKDPAFGRALVAEQPDFDLALFTNPAPSKPRAYLSPKPAAAARPFDPVALLERPDFLTGAVDVIETDAALPGPGVGIADIESYAPEAVRIRVETSHPAVLVLLDAYDKGWTARLESGEEAPIFRGNALVRAVIVPAGAHSVTFRYETPLLHAGAWTSAAGALLCFGLVADALWKRRRTREEP